MGEMQKVDEAGDAEYEALRERRRRARGERRLADMRREVEREERAARTPETVVVTPWGAYTTGQLERMAVSGPDGRPLIYLAPPAPEPEEPEELEELPEPEPEEPEFPDMGPWRPGLHDGHAWLGEYADGDPAPALLPLEATRAHALVVGAAGTGKTRLLLLLAAELLAAGCSVAALDFKRSTLEALRGLAAGLDEPPAVTAFYPDAPAAPGWNPLLEDGPALQRAKMLAEVVQSLSGAAPGSAGRQWDILRNALVVLAARRLSLYELPPLLTDARYREGLLRFAPEPGDAAAWSQAARFFVAEYGAWQAPRREEAAAPLLHKVRDLLMHPFLLGCLCAEANAFSMASLWRRPQLALFHLDRGEGQETARAVAMLATRRLFQAAHRPAGRVPVALLADEAAVLEELSGEMVADTFAQAREAGLRVLAGCQTLGRLSSGLQREALGNAGVMCFLRCGEDEARRFPAPDWRETLPGLPRRVAAVRVGGRDVRLVRTNEVAAERPPALTPAAPDRPGSAGPGMTDRRDVAIREASRGHLRESRLDAPGPDGPNPVAPADGWDADGWSA